MCPFYKNIDAVLSIQHCVTRSGRNFLLVSSVAPTFFNHRDKE